MPTLRDPISAQAQVGAAIRRVRVRIALRHAAQGAATVAGTVALLVLGTRRAAWPLGVRVVAGLALGFAIAVVVALLRRGQRTDVAAAARLERSYPSLRNLAITAEELLRAPDRTPPYMRDRVMQAAAAGLAGIDLRRVVPLWRDTGVCLAALAALLLALPFARFRGPAEATSQEEPTRRLEAATAGDLVVDVDPPPYTRRPPVRLRNPSSMDVLAGSGASIQVIGAPAINVRINGDAPVTAANGAVHAVLRESGFVAVDAGALHRLVPLTVSPDAAPEVRMVAPGKDVRVADAGANIPLRASATDDLGLTDLAVRYTIVSGGGEQFTFTEGALPATVQRSSERSWDARASLSLAALKLEPGDALVYRAVARDARPGAAGEASSDTYFVEIAGPGDVALEGIDMPPDRDRYALSQAMIVVKIQRLLAREKGLARGDLEAEAATIAAEQRAVRANFIFLLGGEVEDEVVEAEASHEIQEGRLANQARREIVAATVLMGRVEQALAALSTTRALPLAQEAVRTLQRAFGHSRYLLRALPARIRIDPARRLSGDASHARDWSRLLAPAPDDPSVARARDVLANYLAVSRDLDAADAVARLSALAEQLLAMAPTAIETRRAAQDVLAARDALAAHRVAEARAALQRAAPPIVQRAQAGRIDAPSLSRDAQRLAGAASADPVARRRP